VVFVAVTSSPSQKSQQQGRQSLGSGIRDGKKAPPTWAVMLGIRLMNNLGWGSGGYVFKKLLENPSELSIKEIKAAHREIIKVASFRLDLWCTYFSTVESECLEKYYNAGSLYNAIKEFIYEHDFKMLLRKLEDLIIGHLGVTGFYDYVAEIEKDMLGLLSSFLEGAKKNEEEMSRYFR
jgi:hypothetical protein